jgi:hypothetical protein
MDKDTLQKEIQANFSIASWEAYREIRDSYLIVLHGKYDSLRDEICKCITFKCFQASITLTNHLLELLLKDSLIFKDCGFAKLDSPEKLDIYGRAVDKFDNLELSVTINRARTADIITRDEKKKLHEFREKFRNAYSHAQKKKIFNDQPRVNFVMANFDSPTISEVKSVPASDFFLAHGEMQAAMASNDAIPYFLYVDRILCREEVKRHPDILEKPELYKRHFNL